MLYFDILLVNDVNFVSQQSELAFFVRGFELRIFFVTYLMKILLQLFNYYVTI